ncbi:hypothetical protein [Janthinobacterium sp.]|uniref:hypothetical protein n=1 Tax=Janthinobacterium sp. TaxID=1871054 RepID=UPI00293D96C6|nr:hypothetical protein [Janthinobacterium sp.]
MERPSESGARRWLDGAGRLLARLGFVALASQAGAQAAPPLWFAYAEQLGQQLQARLNDTERAGAPRLHDWAARRRLREGQATSVLLRVWLTPHGQMQRYEAESFGEAGADADLRSLLSAPLSGGPPPPGMRQPLLLQLELDGAP